MLAADKLQLQSALKQQATALKEKEFNLHHSNLMTVGTQAAVLAGLDITMFIEFNAPENSMWGENNELIPRALKFLYYIMILGGFCANMLVVSHTTALSVLGAGLALRGPDGSMVTATDGLYEERKTVFFTFGIGLVCTLGSVIFCIWLILHWEAALVCTCVLTYTWGKIYSSYKRVVRRFDFDESQTVDFDDIFNGPAAIRVVKKGLRTLQELIPHSPRRSGASTRYDDDDGSTYVGTNEDVEDEESGLYMPDMNGGGSSHKKTSSRRRNGRSESS
mmetsp:Transcript_23141/g.38253  ORF Transcript_23141/g.38253 Transcript_23141/m.38253 type:complete len:277 (+) Transcript_23141:175-1005(+)